MGEEDLSITFGPNGQFEAYLFFCCCILSNPVIRVMAEAFKQIFRVMLK